MQVTGIGGPLGGTRNNMQHLLKFLVDNGYVYHCRKYRDSDDVSDVFFGTSKFYQVV